SSLPRRLSSSTLSSDSQPYSGVAARSRRSTRSLTAMSASETGDEAPLVQFFSSVRNSDNASAPASRTVSRNSAASRAQILSAVSASAKRQALDAQRRRVDAVAEFQVVGGDQRLEHRQQMARDRHLADRVRDLAILYPEAGSAAAVIAGHAVDAGSDQVGDVKSLLDVGDQLLRRHLTGFEMQIIRSRRRRGRDAAVRLPGLRPTLSGDARSEACGAEVKS